MKLFVSKAEAATKEKLCEIDVPLYYTIHEVKLVIWHKTGIPTQNQRLVFTARVLEDDALLCGFGGIQAESTFYVVHKETTENSSAEDKIQFESLEADTKERKDLYNAREKTNNPFHSPLWTKYYVKSTNKFYTYEEYAKAFPH